MVAVESKGMLSNGLKRGFPPERLRSQTEPKVKRDDGGYHLFTLNEGVKVYFEEYYHFLEQLEIRAHAEQKNLIHKINHTDPEHQETLSFYRAKKVIIDLLLRTIYSFYTDGNNLGVIMSPWCFGTVVLEKAEIYREKIARGEVQDQNIPDYPYYVLKYLDEIYKRTLLELFGFPEKAFSVRWQYTELLKRYSKVLTGVTSSLQSVLLSLKHFGGT